LAEFAREIASVHEFTFASAEFAVFILELLKYFQTLKFGKMREHLYEIIGEMPVLV
jgi:hypothetical protein